MTSRKRFVAGAISVIAATAMLLSGCSGENSTSSKEAQTGSPGSTVTMAFRTPNWILPISAPGFTQGENAIFTNALYTPLYNYDLNSNKNTIFIPLNLWVKSQNLVTKAKPRP